MDLGVNLERQNSAVRNFITETFATLALLFIDKSSRKLVAAYARIMLSNAQKELKRSYQNGCKKLLIQRVVIKFHSAIEAGRSQVTLSGVPEAAHLSRKSRKRVFRDQRHQDHCPSRNLDSSS